MTKSAVADAGAADIPLSDAGLAKPGFRQPEPRADHAGQLPRDTTRNANAHAGPFRRRLVVGAGQAYRKLMINLDDLAATVAGLGPAIRILEIGCGKGAMATRIARAFPAANYLGIDPAERPGRNFQGDRSGMVFRRLRTTDLRAEGPDPFDLVLVVDVLHHTPVADRSGLLEDAKALTRPGGLVVIVEWASGRSPADLFTYLTCRWLTHDSNVRFLRGTEIADLVAATFPGFEVVQRTRVPPHRQNLLLALREPAQTGLKADGLP